MKKVVFVIKDMHTFGGGQAHLIGKANWLSESGYDVSICTYLKATDEHIFNKINKNIDCYYVSNTGLFGSLIRKYKEVLVLISKYTLIGNKYYSSYFYYIFNLKYFLKYHNPDYVVSYVPDSNLVAGYACRNLPVKHVMEHTSDPNSYFKYRKYGLELKTLAVEAYVNTFLMDRFADYVSKSASKKIIPAYIDEDRFRSPVQEKPAKRNSKTILSVAKINPNKNTLLLIQSFSKLAKDFPEWNLVIYGEKHDKYYKKIVYLINKHKLNNQVHIKAPRFNLNEIYASSSFFVFPSLSEGWSRSMNEAMYFGLPCVVVSDCYATSYVVKKSDGGLVASNKPNDFAAKLRYMIVDHEMRHKLGENARKFASKLKKRYVLTKWETIFE